MFQAFKRLLAWLGLGSRPPGSQADPYAWKPVPRKPRPNDRAGVVAVAEPDDK